MPVTFACTCGKTLRIADEHAGRRVKCPACNAIIAPPAPEPEFKVVEDKQKHARDEDDDDAGGYGMNPEVITPDEPKKKPRFRRRTGTDDYDEDPTTRRRSRSSSTISSDAGRRVFYAAGGIVLTLLGIGAAFGSVSARGSFFGAMVALGGLIMLGRVITNNMPGS